MKRIDLSVQAGRTIARNQSSAMTAAPGVYHAALSVWLAAALVLIAFGCAVFANPSHAQPAATDAITGGRQAQASSATPKASLAQDKADIKASQPRYTASQAKLMFSYLDTNHDGKISRKEAARANKVSKYFDRADTNHDQSLSLEEFSAALNQAKVTSPGP